jgi:hypothetical protein
VLVCDEGLQIDGHPGLRLKDMQSLHGSLASAKDDIWAKTKMASDTATGLPGQDEPPTHEDDFFNTPERISRHPSKQLRLRDNRDDNAEVISIFHFESGTKANIRMPEDAIR